MITALVFAVVLGADTPLANPREEERAQALMREIRCVVCENEPVSHSTADIARDMRRMIREQVQAGATNDQVRKYFSDRYGQFVLFRPPTEGFGMLLWLFPFTLLAAAGGAIFWRLRGRRRARLSPLVDEGLDEPL